MKNLFSYVTRAPKRIGAFTALLLALVALPINSALAADVLMEGSIGVANQTTGETVYKTSTNASYDQVVKFSVYYHNRELPDSGRVANDFKIKVDFPTAAGTNQVVKVTMGGSNTNTVTDTATVNLNRADAHLEFIPGSTYWTHNTGSRANPVVTSTHIGDSVILNGTVIENVQPCHEYEATVSFMARVRVPSVSIVKAVRVEGVGTATKTLNAQPNARIEYLITVKNLGNETLTNTKVRDALPAGITFVPGTVKLYNGPNPNGVVINNDLLFHAGVNGGSMGPGATIYYKFTAMVASADKLQCGTNNLKNIAVVDTDQTGEYNNDATVSVNKTCAQTPTYSCNALNVTKVGGRQVTLGVTYTATNGATFKNVSYEFGDGTPALVTDKTSSVLHTYAQDGEYNLVATVRFNVNGSDTNSACEAKVVFTTPSTPGTPTTLVNTGAGDVVGLFAATSAAGAVAHQVVSRRSRRS